MKWRGRERGNDKVKGRPMQDLNRGRLKRGLFAPAPHSAPVTLIFSSVLVSTNSREKYLTLYVLNTFQVVAYFVWLLFGAGQVTQKAAKVGYTLDHLRPDFGY